MSYGSDFVLTLLTDDVDLAVRAERAGVERIGLDLEQVGKQERQGHLDTRMSDHVERDFPVMRRALRTAELFARTNPIHPGLRGEIDRLIAAGADVLMLPYFHSVREVAEFIELVGGRCRAALLLETPAAVVRIDEILALDGIHEIQVGLNDLYLGLGLDNHFELMTSDLIARLAEKVHAAGLPFGAGGVARAGDDRLPIPPDLVLAQCARLRTSRAIVSRVFLPEDHAGVDLSHEIRAVRDRLDEWWERPTEDLERARRELHARALEWGCRGRLERGASYLPADEG